LVYGSPQVTSNGGFFMSTFLDADMI